MQRQARGLRMAGGALHQRRRRDVRSSSGKTSRPGLRGQQRREGWTVQRSKLSPAIGALRSRRPSGLTRLDIEKLPGAVRRDIRPQRSDRPRLRSFSNSVMRHRRVVADRTDDVEVVHLALRHGSRTDQPAINASPRRERPRHS